MATLTRQQLEANIQAMEKQGAKQPDIQAYLNTLQGPPVSRETAAPSNFGAAQPAEPRDGFLKTLVKAPLEALIVKPVVRTAQAIEGVGREVLGLGSDKGREDWARRASSDVKVPIPLLGDINVEAVKPGFAGIKQALGEGLEAGSYLVGGGAAKGVAQGAVKSTIGRAAVQGAKVGAKSGAIYGAGAGLQEDKDLGGIVGSTLTGAAVGGLAGGATGAAFTGARHALLGKQSTAEEAATAAGRVFQGSAKDPSAQKYIEKTAPGVLSKIDTTGVKSYDDLSRVLESHVDRGLNEVDEALKVSSQRLPIKALDRTVDAVTDGGRKVSTSQNFVKDALADMEELYTKTRNPAEKLRIKAIAQKVKTEGLSPFEINQLAREYGTVFKKKAFSPTGPLTSVNAVTYENTRKGLKETARSLFEGDALKNLDKEVSDMLRLKSFADQMAGKVTALENRVKDRGVIEKLFRGAGHAVDVATFGGPRAFITKLLFPSNVGLKTMNSIDLQNELAKNLRIIRNLEHASDSTVISALRGLAINAGLIKPVSVFGRNAAPKLGSEAVAAGKAAVDKTVAKMPTARYTESMTKTAVKPQITEREVQDWVSTNLKKHKSQEELVDAVAKKFKISTLEARDNVLDYIDAAFPPEDRAGVFTQGSSKRAVPEVDPLLKPRGMERYSAGPNDPVTREFASLQNKFNSSIRSRIEYNRKPTDIADVVYKVPEKYLDDVEKLPVFTQKELGLKKLFDEFKKQVPQHFVLETPDGKFLVNTEGANYVRYAAKVPLDEGISKRAEGQFIRREAERLGKADAAGKGEEYRNKGLIVASKEQKTARTRAQTEFEKNREISKKMKLPEYEVGGDPTVLLKGEMRKKAHIGVMSEKLRNAENEIWSRLGIRSGGQLSDPKNQSLLNKYYAELAKLFAADGKFAGKVPQEVVDDLENENYHTLVEFLHSRKLIKK